MSVWNPENIRDVAESIGVGGLTQDVLSALTRDVDFRLGLVLEEAIKFMKHSKRNILFTSDISQALSILDIEPLYGYNSTKPLRFGEAHLGPGQQLYYIEDEEVDLEKLINAPLPKVPREMTFTAHWLAVEGVQPTIPQNPTTADVRQQELLPKGPGANPNLAALAGQDNITVKPLVKHMLSRELQLYFDKVSSAILDPIDEEYRLAALSSLRGDPGLHQLVPYFTQFIAEKVTHSLTSISTLTSMLQLAEALLENPSLFLTPHVPSLIPPILTCLISPRLGTPTAPLEVYPLRSFAADLLGKIAEEYSSGASTLRPRLVRTCLRDFLEPKKPFSVHYGAILGLARIGGTEVVRQLVLPNLQEYSELLREGLAENDSRSKEAEMTIGAIIGALRTLEEEDQVLFNGFASEDIQSKRPQLEEKLGPLLAERVIAEGSKELVQAVLTA